MPTPMILAQAAHRPNRAWCLLVLLLVTVLAACGSAAPTATPAPPDPRADVSIIFVTHGQAADPFWKVVQRGMEQAAADMRVNVSYRAPEIFDVVQMQTLIDEAAAEQPDGLVVSVPDIDALRQHIEAAVAAGVPVITINSGAEFARELGVLAHIGQTEYEAGLRAGQELGAQGVDIALCVNHEVGNVGLDERCTGFADGLAETGGLVEILDMTLMASDEAVRARLIEALNTNTRIDGMLTLGSGVAALAYQAVQAAGLADRVQIATFDLSPAVLEAIADGGILFAIDQQQYLQGYLPVVWLTLNATNLNVPGSIINATGPGLVTQANAEQIAALAAEGTR